MYLYLYMFVLYIPVMYIMDVPLCKIQNDLALQTGGGIGSYAISWLAARLTVRPRVLLSGAEDELPASWSKPSKSRLVFSLQL